MNGFKRVLKFGVWGTFKDARTIADDIIVSLVRNSGLEKEEEKDWLSTYTSTIKEDFLYALGDFSSSDDSEELKSEDKYVSKWIIRIYEAKGNRGSRLSVTQNKELRDIACQ